MKYNNREYSLLRKIDHNSNLAIFLNKVFESLQTARIISRPRTFNEFKNISEEDKREDRVCKVQAVFYETCLFDIYANSLIDKLVKWIDIVNEYREEYDYNWEYYARSKRQMLIEKYGGDDTDYNKDGSINIDIDIDVLKGYSIINDLVDDSCVDIVTQTKPNDLNYIHTLIHTDGKFSMRDMFNAMGANHLKTYRTENGMMVENSIDDESLQNIVDQSNSEYISHSLDVICIIINNIIDEIKELKIDDDNKKYFKDFPSRLHDILNLRLDKEKRRYLKRYITSL